MSGPARAALSADRTAGGVAVSRRLLFWCPGCNEPHGPRVAPEGAEPGEPHWSWNGSLELPTLSPSIRVSGVRLPRDGAPADAPWPPFVCHSFVRAGRIEFCSDSTHALAGATVDLPPWDSAHLAGEGS